VSLPTVADLKTHLDITSTKNDDELQDHLDSAVEMVEGIVGPIGEPTTVTETHYNVSSDVLVLRRMPVAALTSVSSRYGATTTPLTLGDYELDPATGLVRVANGYGFYGTYTVSYTAGRAAMPASIWMACLIIAAHLWETQRGAAPAGPLATDDSFASPGLGFAIPNRALELLAPYRRPVIA